MRFLTIRLFGQHTTRIISSIDKKILLPYYSNRLDQSIRIIEICRCPHESVLLIKMLRSWPECPLLLFLTLSTTAHGPHHLKFESVSYWQSPNWTITLVLWPAAYVRSGRIPSVTLPVIFMTWGRFRF